MCNRNIQCLLYFLRNSYYDFFYFNFLSFPLFVSRYVYDIYYCFPSVVEWKSHLIYYIRKTTERTHLKQFKVEYTSVRSKNKTQWKRTRILNTDPEFAKKKNNFREQNNERWQLENTITSLIDLSRKHECIRISWLLHSGIE